MDAINFINKFYQPLGLLSLGIACINLNRNFIGIEKSAEYFEIAKNRIDNHEVQLRSISNDEM
jgi:DNA modification methylase